MYVHVALCVHVVLCVVLLLLWCCGVVVVWYVARLGARKKTPRVHVQLASVCTFKMPPCVLARRPHVEHIRAFCRCTRRHFETTHGGVRDMSTVEPLSPLLLFFSLRSLLFSSLLFSSLLFSSHQQTLYKALNNEHGVQL